MVTSFPAESIAARRVGAFLSSIIFSLIAGFSNLAKAEPTTQYDQATVEDLALYVAEESIRRLHIPLVLWILSIGHDSPTRQEMIDEIRADPPKADEKGIVYPFGEHNGMSFVYVPETHSMLVNERMMKTRGKMPYWGLTAIEHAAALNEATTEKERGGATFVYNPYRDTLALQMVYDQPPAKRDRFYKDIKQLKKVSLKWYDGKYVDKTNEILAKHALPASATAEKDGFEATVLLRHFGAEPEKSPWSVKRFIGAWDRRVGRRAPRLTTDNELPEGRMMYAFVLFKGATENADGVAEVGASFRLIAPDGSVRLNDMNPLLWNSSAKPEDHLQLGMNNISFRMREEPLGTYRVEADVCDVASSRCVTVTHPFELH